jgi:hypothetical protein
MRIGPSPQDFDDHLKGMREGADSSGMDGGRESRGWGWMGWCGEQRDLKDRLPEPLWAIKG